MRSVTEERRAPSRRTLRIRFMRELGRGLARLRKQAWLKQAELAEELGVAIETISRWENGHNAPTVPHRRKLELRYGNTLEALLDFDPEQWALL
jgi:transcriptional regulator with XRE-family HTH domain